MSAEDQQTLRAILAETAPRDGISRPGLLNGLLDGRLPVPLPVAAGALAAGGGGLWLALDPAPRLWLGTQVTRLGNTLASLFSG